MTAETPDHGDLRKVLEREVSRGTSYTNLMFKPAQVLALLDEIAALRAERERVGSDDLHALVSWMCAATASDPTKIPAEWRMRSQVDEILKLRTTVIEAEAKRDEYANKWVDACDRAHNLERERDELYELVNQRELREKLHVEQMATLERERDAARAEVRRHEDAATVECNVHDIEVASLRARVAAAERLAKAVRSTFIDERELNYQLTRHEIAGAPETGNEHIRLAHALAAFEALDPPTKGPDACPPKDPKAHPSSPR